MWWFHEHEVYCKINLLVGSNIVQDAVVMEKAFCKYTNACACRNIMGRGGKSVSWIYVYPFETVSLPSMTEDIHWGQVPPSGWLDLQRMVQYWIISICLFCLAALHNGSSQISLCERKNMLLIHNLYLYFVYRPTSNLKATFQTENSYQQRRAYPHSKILDIYRRFSIWGFSRGSIQQLCLPQTIPLLLVVLGHRSKW